MSNKTIYYLGNPLVKNDSKVLILIPQLKKQYPQIRFVYYDPTEEFILGEDKEIIIIDLVMGIKNVEIYPNLSAFSSSPHVGVHDYDLFLHLKLLLKLRKIDSIKIIGIPSGRPPEKIFREIKKKVNPLFLP